MLAPPPKTVAASAGNSARGMPNTMAFTSITYAPCTGWDRRMNRSPSSVDRQPGRTAAAPAVGGCGAMKNTADSAITKLHASIQ